MIWKALIAAPSIFSSLVAAGCPFLDAQKRGEDVSLTMSPHRRSSPAESAISSEIERRSYSGRKLSEDVSYEGMKTDINALMRNSVDEWPADYGYYGPFFIRLAWHCAGSYRISDGRGGCDGGRQRFEPEQSWDDNVNLDKARSLLWPIKEKYPWASWGDIFILAGTTALEDMGAPSLGFCGGRIDDADGTASLRLGPTAEQEQYYPCDQYHNCSYPLGTNIVGLIYVEPSGPLGVPDPVGSAAQIRDVFGRMSMNDTETVALIGGGHAFGKAHGACPLGPGPSPAEVRDISGFSASNYVAFLYIALLLSQDPENPWPGMCGSGKGNDTWTSGFEGAWTAEPTKWDNDYFQNLLKYEWEVWTGPGGKPQWRIKNRTEDDPDLMMFTSDIALISDERYLALVERFANDLDYLGVQFANAWYKLTSRDIGPRDRCVGDDVPPAQPFQYPLPAPPASLPNFNSVKIDVMKVITTENSAVLPFDETGNYGPLFVRLAWQCFNTYRSTDYNGGCNGARIRNLPQSEWRSNSFLDKALELLSGVKEKYGDSLTWADLIVLSGTAALEDAAARAGTPITIPFYGGRSDADPSDESTPWYLESRLYGGEEDDTLDVVNDVMMVWGLSKRQFVALLGGGHGIGQMHYDRSGFNDGSWVVNQESLDNEFFRNLLNLDWVVSWPNSPNIEYSAVEPVSGKTLYMLKTDMQLLYDPEYKAIVQEFATDNDAFLKDFSDAWAQVMIADMYTLSTEDGSSTSSSDDSSDLSSSGVAAVILGIFVFFLLIAAVYLYWSRKNAMEKGDAGISLRVASSSSSPNKA
jgi:catalase-peroxidase